MSRRFILMAVATTALGLCAPSGTVPAASAQGVCQTQYRVQPGDTLYAISRLCAVPPEVILDANPRVNFDRLQVGQTISVPRPVDGGYVPPPPPRQPPPPPPPPRPGDGRDARVTIDRAPIEPGGLASIRVSGFRPREIVVVTAGPASGRQLTQYEGTISRNRPTVIEIDIPNRARPGERWIVEAEGDRGGYASAEFRVEAPRPPEEEVTVSGVLTNEGAECPTLRARTGLYSLSGSLGRFRPGDLVTVTGVLSDYSICQAGETIEVDEIRPAR